MIGNVRSGDIMVLCAKWTADGLELVAKILSLSVVKDESGNGNDAMAINISKLYFGIDKKGKPSVGSREACIVNQINIQKGKGGLGFNGHSFMRVPNSPSLDLDKYTIRVKLSTYQPG